MQPGVLLIIALAFLGVWFGIPSLFRWWASRRLARQARARRAIVLTYDDGPSDHLTLPLADLLKRHGVRATFFVIGREVAQRPAIVRRLQEDGHEIGNHTQDHLNAWKAGPFQALRDLRAGERQLKQIGEDNPVFRPPFGKSTLATLLYCLIRRTRLAFWTHDSRDSWGRLPISKVLEQIGKAGGGVLLMHDFDAPRRGPSPEMHHDYLLELTDSVIDFAATHDFRIIPFRDLFENPALSPVKERV